MDRKKHESYAEVCRWTSVLIIIHIRCAYKTVSFSFDINNAFQSTFRSKAVEPGHPPPTRMFCYQAPGFAEHGPDGEKLCCELLMLMQGAIDASRLFGTAFGHTLLKRVGARRALWDREVWEYHKGPLSATAASLESILAACDNMPPAPGAPPGWAVFSKHTDDGLGAANAQLTVDYLMDAIGIDWSIRGWDGRSIWAMVWVYRHADASAPLTACQSSRLCTNVTWVLTIPISLNIRTQ